MIAEVAVLVGIHRPVNRRDHEVGAALASEGLERVERDLGCDPRPDAELGEGKVGIPGPAVGGAARIDAVTAGTARDVRAVSLAVQRVVIGLGCRVRGVAGVVGVAREVVAAGHLRHVRVDGRFPAFLGRECGLVGRDGARPPEIGVGVVNPGVDDPQGDAPAGEARGLPDLGRLHERDRGPVADVVVRQRVNRRHSGDTAQRVDPVRRCLDGYAGVRRRHPEDLASAERYGGPCHGCLHHLDRASLQLTGGPSGARARTGGPLVDRRRGFHIELKHHCDRWRPGLVDLTGRRRGRSGQPGSDEAGDGRRGEEGEGASHADTLPTGRPAAKS